MYTSATCGEKSDGSPTARNESETCVVSDIFMLSRVTISRLVPLRHTFFVKVSLWLWLGMVLVGVAFAISAALTEPSSFDRTEKAVISTLLPREAARIVPDFEERGAASATDRFNASERLFGLRLMLYDESLREVAGNAGGVT